MRNFVIDFVTALIFFIILVLLVCHGCQGTERCRTEGAFRCNDNEAELCGSDHVWLAWDDCRTLYKLDGGVVDGTCCYEDGITSCRESCE